MIQTTFTSHIADLRRDMLPTDMPEMPPDMLEFYRVAYLYRRKYSHPDGADADGFFRRAADDMLLISNAYDNDETMMGLLVEAYRDIERQFIEVHANDELENIS